MTNKKIIDIVAHKVCHDIMNHKCTLCPFHLVGASTTNTNLCCRWTHLNIPIDVAHKVESLLDSVQYTKYRELCLEQGYDPDSCKEVDFV